MRPTVDSEWTLATHTHADLDRVRERARVLVVETAFVLVAYPDRPIVSPVYGEATAWLPMGLWSTPHTTVYRPDGGCACGVFPDAAGAFVRADLTRLKVGLIWKNSAFWTPFLTADTRFGGAHATAFVALPDEAVGEDGEVFLGGPDGKWLIGEVSLFLWNPRTVRVRVALLPTPGVQ